MKSRTELSSKYLSRWTVWWLQVHGLFNNDGQWAKQREEWRRWALQLLLLHCDKLEASVHRQIAWALFIVLYRCFLSVLPWIARETSVFNLPIHYVSVNCLHWCNQGSWTERPLTVDRLQEKTLLMSSWHIDSVPIFLPLRKFSQWFCKNLMADLIHNGGARPPCPLWLHQWLLLWSVSMSSILPC